MLREEILNPDSPFAWHALLVKFVDKQEAPYFDIHGPELYEFIFQNLGEFNNLVCHTAVLLGSGTEFIFCFSVVFRDLGAVWDVVIMENVCLVSIQ